MHMLLNLGDDDKSFQNYTQRLRFVHLIMCLHLIMTKWANQIIVRQKSECNTHRESQ